MNTLNYEVDCIVRDADRNPVAVIECAEGFVVLSPAQIVAGVEGYLSTRNAAPTRLTALAHHNFAYDVVGS